MYLLTPPTLALPFSMMIGYSTACPGPCQVACPPRGEAETSAEALAATAAAEESRSVAGRARLPRV